MRNTAADLETETPPTIRARSGVGCWDHLLWLITASMATQSLHKVFLSRLAEQSIAAAWVPSGRFSEATRHFPRLDAVRRRGASPNCFERGNFSAPPATSRKPEAGFGYAFGIIKGWSPPKFPALCEATLSNSCPGRKPSALPRAFLF